MEPITKSFLGEPDTWRNAKVELDDIHDLWGGKCITVYGDGTAFVKIVDLDAFGGNIPAAARRRAGAGLFEALLAERRAGAGGSDGQPRRRRDLHALSITNAEARPRSLCHWELGAVDERFEDVRNAAFVRARSYGRAGRAPGRSGRAGGHRTKDWPARRLTRPTCSGRAYPTRPTCRRPPCARGRQPLAAAGSAGGRSLLHRGRLELRADARAPDPAPAVPGQGRPLELLRADPGDTRRRADPVLLGPAAQRAGGQADCDR